jgi:hypothetical protein
VFDGQRTASGAVLLAITLSTGTVGIMGVLGSWRTPDRRFIVDQLFGEAAQHRVWELDAEPGDGYYLVAELLPPTERLREWLTRHGWDLGDLIPLAEQDQEEGNDDSCE